MKRPEETQNGNREEYGPTYVGGTRSWQTGGGRDPGAEEPAGRTPWSATAGLPARSFWRRYRVNLTMFLLTALSTLWMGREHFGWPGGAWYALAIMAILLAHEMGHYLACRVHGVPATLPYFIPMPVALFGTLGAVILMRGRMNNRRVLFDVGVAGPLAGLVVALPAAVVGLRHSHVVEIGAGEVGAGYLGLSLLFFYLIERVVGPGSEGLALHLHPLAFAGWAGLYLTALNLLPIGQLDGGHVTYAIFGRRSYWVSVGMLVVFTFISLFLYPFWVFLIVLILLFGFRHPPPLDDNTPLDWRRRVVGWGMLVLFILSFTPVPFTF